MVGTVDLTEVLVDLTEALAVDLQTLVSPVVICVLLTDSITQ